jgi:threonine synthase
MSTLTHLECSHCGDNYEVSQLQTFCQECNTPLVARYDLEAAGKKMTKEIVSNRPRGMWRWRELLPVIDLNNIVSLGEGDSPLLIANRLGKGHGFFNLYIKDESGQPTGSFKARGLAMAVSKAIELGVREIVVPTAGNAGGALSAYAAKAGITAHIYMPKDAPNVNIVEVEITGADLHKVDGIISDAGKLAGEAARENGWFDVSTLKEPYRLEGKKTMGLEVAEDFNWQLPDVIIYPTGGGTGLIGMWKAFQELEAIGWIGSKRPRMVSVQSDGCAPIVRAFDQKSETALFWENANTIAAGLRVPSAFGDRMILNTLYESGGRAIAVSDEQILLAQAKIATLEGLFVAPEGAATFAAALNLLDEGWIQKDEKVLLYNTGTGLKYI